MIFTSIPEYLAALLAPLKYVLLAYTISGAEGEPAQAVAFAKMLGLSGAPDTAAAAWELYANEEEKTAESVRETTEAGVMLPFERVCGVFGLNPFERFALTLTLATETDPLYAAAVSTPAQRLTPNLLLRLYSASAAECISWQAAWLEKGASLRLIFGDAVLNDMNSSVLLRPAVKKFLLGVDMTPEGASLFTPASPLPEPLTECGAGESIAGQLQIRPAGNLFILTGPRGAGKKYQLKRFAKEKGVPLMFVPYARLRPDDGPWLDQLTAALALTGSFLCVSGLPAQEGGSLPEGAGRPDGGDLPSKLIRLIWAIRPGNIFVTGEEATFSGPEGYSAVRISLPQPDNKSRLNLWQAYAAAYGLPEDGLAELAAQYRFTVGQIESSCRLAAEMAAQQGGGGLTAPLLHQACRRQFTHKLGSLAMPVKAHFTWDDIVLPLAQTRLLHHICDQVKYRDQVYADWGFAAKTSYGRGVRALFSGPPGTGKTMAAQIIAAELNMELYKVDLSSLVSKYIGDTEKNLDEVFSQAAKSSGILFFDEADAIFGKRGEQKDSHDKYANMQTAFLLQRFEEHDGVVLLATNLISNLDPAFTRRIQNRVDFPVPSATYRKQIWNSLLLKTAPFTEDIDSEFFAEKFELTGSAIKNIVLQAAFLAAAAGRGIGMGELVDALIMEFAKVDKIISRQDLGEYGYYWADNA